MRKIIKDYAPNVVRALQQQKPFEGRHLEFEID